MSDTIEKNNVPTSFGAFKPVGHVMIGLPARRQAIALETELSAAGWSDEALIHFTPHESVDEMQALIDNASGLAGFGYEITLMRRYVGLAREGCYWLLVRVDDEAHAADVVTRARRHGAKLAVHYRALVVEELI